MKYLGERTGPLGGFWPGSQMLHLPRQMTLMMDPPNTHEMSSTLRGATGVALQLTKYCTCHKTGTLMIDTRHI